MTDFDLRKITGREPPIETDEDMMNALADALGDADALRTERDALRARVADHETYRDFWRRHAMPPLATPSCLVCGRVLGDWPPAIQHMALPSVIVCTPCVEASRTAGNKTAASNEVPK